MTPELRRILAIGRLYWPGVKFYREQRQMIESVCFDNETVLVAGNDLGKDFGAAFVCTTFFLWPQLYFPAQYVAEIERMRAPGIPDYLVHTRRIVTTSVKERHLKVLWGEIGRFVATAAHPLLESRGGPLSVNSLEIRLKQEAEVKTPMNYLLGQVAGKEESMAGHHAAYTLFVGDEASGLSNSIYEQAQGWAKRMLIFGNPNNTRNFFYEAVKTGNIVAA